ncbi:suppressor of cytokine signaling 6-like [Thrips palmi]|uniref:Suppressor of cytokine signaling 6-like n=1 Tax=Thrips palmi TaxID=161013 RepID=A0A6P8ZVK2_THRPL|nr:suppressor of cytokine signaling 6-like [Thrips palmi]
MTCIQNSKKLHNRSLNYINSVFRQGFSMRADMNQQEDDNHDEDSDNEQSSDEKPSKAGFLSNIKRIITDVRSKYRSRVQKSLSLNESRGPFSTMSNSNPSDESPEEDHPIADMDMTDQTQSLSGHLQELSKYGWYWGPLTREKAEETLSNQPEGSFLVRDSGNDHFLLTVSFRCSGRTFHTRIFHASGKFSLYSVPEPYPFSSIPEMIEHSISSSQSNVFCYSRPRSPGHPSFPVRLAKPVSRITHVESLKYLCRFVIRQHTSVDQIKNLPLPTSVCRYIEEGQF